MFGTFLGPCIADRTWPLLRDYNKGMFLLKMLLGFQGGLGKSEGASVYNGL